MNENPRVFKQLFGQFGKERRPHS